LGGKSSLFSLQRKRKGIVKRKEVTLLCGLFRGGVREEWQRAWSLKEDKKNSLQSKSGG
jgi:hypothetical protein